MSKNLQIFFAKILPINFYAVFFRQQTNFLLLREIPRAFHPAAVTNEGLRASIYLDMRLQNGTKMEPLKSARLNRLVFGVALLWVATSLLLLLMYRTHPAHDARPDNASQAHKLAIVASRSVAQPSYIF